MNFSIGLEMFRRVSFVLFFMLNFIIDGGHGMADINSKITKDDNVWNGKTPSNKAEIDVLPSNYYIDDNLNISESLVGCTKNLDINNKSMENLETIGEIPCSDHVEPGVFFGIGGGYVKLSDSFKMGVDLDVKMEIKPKNLSGLIMAVHGRRDYFVIQLDGGALKVTTVENGMGPITAKYMPNPSHSFCDGHWHKIRAIKLKTVVILAVNGIYSVPGVGDHRSSTTNTASYVFLGGHSLIDRVQGLIVRIPYMGCIRNVQLNNENMTIYPEMAKGNVSIGSCPIN